MSDTFASFCANAWKCARRTTDRDHERVSAVKKVNAWICAPPTTDHDPASVIPDKKEKSVTTVIFCGSNVCGIKKFRDIFPFFLLLTKWLFQ